MTPALITELEALLTDDQRRLSVAAHEAFLREFVQPQTVDEIDLAVQALEQKGERP